MLLSALAERVDGRVLGADVDITDVTHDSRTGGPGMLFVAIRGFERDGHAYVDAALAAGAAAVAVEEADEAVTASRLLVPDTRAALGPLAAAVHGDPSRRMAVVGVTGTNGKTTVAHLVESIVGAAGLTSGVIGTVGARVAGTPVPVPRTTPEASDLQRLLADMVSAGVDVAAIEVSSHALALGRVNGTRFAVGAFTNLMQDHLDFHGDMDSYFDAKRRLFDAALAEQAVIAVDGEPGRVLASTVQVPVTTTAVDADADLRARDITSSLDGSSFTVFSPHEAYPAWIPLPGAFNIENAMVAVGIATRLGIDRAAITAGLAAVGGIPGRFEAVDAGQPYGVIVDYAHTPDAIAAVVTGARHLVGGRIIAVVGAGGDRDRDKRPAMGAAAAEADLTVITTDNPRSEEPAAIIEQVIAGVPDGAEVVTEPDRRAAIRTALGSARPGDLVLILGKGHEQGQEVAGTLIPFDDRVVAREELEAGVGA
jgi:UDP-N-acetylmuramoyl-L-alanyl-D-glutamate--2,6-diaminopimelate ligase